MPRSRFGKAVLWTVVGVLAATAVKVLWAAWQTAEGRNSICFGSPRQGRLEGGKRPPISGPNYRAYDAVLWAWGRTSMHGKVRDALVKAYASVAKARPELHFVYGESGWPRGGRFPPHKTHRNGLSVDFMVPVRDSEGRVTEIPTTIANHFGYEQRFDNDGKADGLAIDFEAAALHIGALARAASSLGIGIEVIILEQELQERILATEAGRSLKDAVRFSTKRPWVRHDNHYHVDFAVPCEPFDPPAR